MHEHRTEYRQITIWIQKVITMLGKKTCRYKPKSEYQLVKLMPVGHLIDKEDRVDDNESNIHIGEIPDGNIVFKGKHLNFLKAYIWFYNSSSKEPFSGQGRKYFIAGSGMTK